MRITTTGHPARGSRHMSLVDDLNDLDADNDDDDYAGDGYDPPLLPPSAPVIFAAYLQGQASHPSGEITARLGIPFEQIPNFWPMLEFPGGVMFKVTAERISGEESLPEGGWGQRERDEGEGESDE